MDRRTYLSHFGVLASGTISAQLVNLAAYPLLGRLYSPAQFGLFALFVTICAVPGVVACGRFDLTLPIVREPTRFGAYWLCLSVAVGVGLLSAAAFAAYWLLWSPPVPVWVVPLVGMTVFLTGYCTATSSFMMRHDRYNAASASLFIRTSSAVASQAGLALLLRDARGLVLGFSFGLLMQALFLLSRSAPILRGHPLRPIEMRIVARRYRRQVSIDAPSTLIGVLSTNLLNPILLALYNAATVGHFALAQRIAIVPLQLFNDSLAQVFYQKAARTSREQGGFWREMKFSLSVSALLSLGALAAIWLFAKPFIAIYLGKRWDASADMLVVLAPYLALQAACMSIATSVFILKKPQWLLYHNVATMVVQLVALYTAWYLQLEVRQFLVIFASMMGAEYLLYGSFLAWIVRRSDQARRQGTLAA